MQKTVPIIAMTANAFADDEERSLAAGMDAHISKPLDAEKLIQVISDICKKAERACKRRCRYLISDVRKKCSSDLHKGTLLSVRDVVYFFCEIYKE